MVVEKSASELIDLIKGSIERRNEAISYLYQRDELKAKIIGYIMKHGGNRTDAEDVFVDAIIAFVKNAKKPGFSINQNLDSYLFGTARFVWYGKLRTKDKTIELEPQKEIPGVDNPYDVLITADQKKWIQLFLNEIDEKCQKVLKMWAHHYSMSEIRESLKYKSDVMARKKKYLCIKKLYALIKQKKEWAKRLREL